MLPLPMTGGKNCGTVPAEEFVSRVHPRALGWPKPGPMCYGWSIAVVLCECAAWLVAVVRVLD